MRTLMKLGQMIVALTVRSPVGLLMTPEWRSVDSEPPHLPPDDPRNLTQFQRNVYANDALLALTSARVSIIDKELIAMDVLEAFDPTSLEGFAHDIMAGGLMDDWNFDQF